MGFLLGVIVLITAVHLYLWKRLVKDTTRPGTARRVGTALAVLLPVLVVLAFVGRWMFGSTLARWFAWPGYVWFGLMFYLALVLAVLELPRLALRRWTRRTPLVADATTARDDEQGSSVETEEPADEATSAPTSSRRLLLARGTAIVAGVAATGLTGTGMVNALGPPELKRVTVPLRRLDPALTGFRIALVSDIHLGPLLGRWHTERLVRMINEAEPDLVAVVGDLVDGTVEQLGPAVEPLRDLVAREGSFFVTGNHEYYSGHQAWITELDRIGVHPLRNERTQITRGGAAFDLAGVNDVAGRPFDDGPDIARSLRGRDSSRPVVLLAHQPVQVGDAARHDVDLLLSGHTHGGQLYPFHHVVRMVQPSLAGLSQVEDTWLYVTRGAGFWGPPVRIGAPPDITVVELAAVR